VAETNIAQTIQRILAFEPKFLISKSDIPSGSLSSQVPHPPAKLTAPSRAVSAPRGTNPSPAASGDGNPVEQKVLDALSELAALHVHTPPRELVGLMAGYRNLTSKAIARAFATLREQEFISGSHDGRISLTASGEARARRVDSPGTADEMRNRIITVLGTPVDRILAKLVEVYPRGIDRTELANSVGYTNLTSKAFAQSMSRLRDMGFMDTDGPGNVKASAVLFP
jgi:hypothetical protein